MHVIANTDELMLWKVANLGGAVLQLSNIKIELWTLDMWRGPCMPACAIEDVRLQAIQREALRGAGGGKSRGCVRALWLRGDHLLPFPLGSIFWGVWQPGVACMGRQVPGGWHPCEKLCRPLH